MDIKTLAGTIITALASLATGFGLADATTIQTLATDLTTAVGAIIAIVALVSTTFFHKKAVAKAAADAAAAAPVAAPKA
jgi:hypothetical protein